MRSLIEDFREFYKLYDLGQGGMLSDEAIDKYHERMLNVGALTFETDTQDKLLGYIECWRVTPEQIGRIMFDEQFNVFTEDIEYGPICFVANITIRPDARRRNLLNLLKNRAIETNFTATHFCGRASHGRARAFKIFTKKEYWAREGIENVY